MVDFSAISLENQEVIDFLRRDLRLKSIYQEIISQKIVSQVAQEQALSVTAEEVQAELDKIRYENYFEHPAQLLAWLAEQMSTLSDLQQRIYERLLSQKLARHLFSEAAQNFFSQHRSEFEQALIYRIKIPYESLAYEVFYQIEEEELNFFEAAHLYDANESRRLQCGYAGKQQRGEISPEIAERLFNAQIGEVLGPFKNADNTYELFLVDEIFPPTLTSTLYESLLNQMFQEWIENRLDIYISSLRPSQDTERS
ncbi:peptidylprolyl isomerase [Egbenema bharatensis]|uniref:peptidylprolyl isomerase n=1 Tax=Egbenema bharatensis TaxID=3463334 RepID=UPI003A88B100